MDVGLREDREIACMDALRGDPPGPSVAARIQLAVIGVLTAHRLKGFKVIAKSDRSGTSVQILLRKPDRRVEQVVLTIG